MGSTYDRSYYVITADGDRGPYTREEVRDLLQRGEITATCRLRSAFARDLGTVGDLLRRSPRRSSDPRMTPIHRPLTLRLLLVLGMTALVGGVGWVVSLDVRGNRVPMGEVPSPTPPQSLPLPPDLSDPAVQPVAIPQATPTELLPSLSSTRPSTSTAHSPSTAATPPSSRRRLLGCDPLQGLPGLIDQWEIRDDERGGISLRREDGISFIRLASHGDRTCMLRKVIAIDPDLRTVSLTARVRATVRQVGTESWYLPRITLQWGDRREDRHETAIQWRETTPWQTVERTITVPPGSALLRVWLGTNRCTGELDVASLEITTH